MADMAEDESVVLTALGACPSCGCYEERPVLEAPPNIPENPASTPQPALECHCNYRWIIDLNTCTAPENPFRQEIMMHSTDCTDIQREDGNA